MTQYSLSTKKVRQLSRLRLRRGTAWPKKERISVRNVVTALGGHKNRFGDMGEPIEKFFIIVR